MRASTRECALRRRTISLRRPDNAAQIRPGADLDCGVGFRTDAVEPGQDAIATVAGRGYRFTLEPAQTVSAPQPSSLVAKHNLPAQVSSFIGRERELVDLGAMLKQVPAGDAVGDRRYWQDPPGAGSRRPAWPTRMPTASGSWISRRFRIRASLPMRSPRASGSGTSRAGRSSKRCIGSSGTGFCCSCSTIASICCPHARSWHGTSCRPVGRYKIVATSREPLHLSGEATFPLPTLPAPDPLGERRFDALREFAGEAVSRSRNRRPPGLRTDSPEPPAVARICRELDGIPLAFELAAARVRSMSAEAIAGRLDDRFGC